MTSRRTDAAGMMCLVHVGSRDAVEGQILVVRRHRLYSRSRHATSMTSTLTITLLLVFVTCDTGYALFMLTRGQQIVVDVNDTVVIDCQFQETSDDRFNLFDNPVHWTKSQLNERSRINMMVNLIKPFSLVDQGRLRVSFAGTTPNYTMTLVIAHIVAEDTANYTCIVSGPHNVILASVTHLVQVRAGMQQLKLTQVVRRTNLTDDVQRTLASTTPDQRAASLAVDCVAVGGCPPASVVMRLGRREVSDLFTTVVDRSLSGKRRSMRRVEFSVVRRHREVAGLTATTAHDGLTLRCLATVSGSAPLSVGLRLTVLYGPIIKCDDVTATPGDSDVVLPCSVNARPQVTSLYWMISNKTTVTDVTLGSNYVTIVRDTGGGSGAQLESQLLIRHVTADSFRTFTIVAENDVSTALRDIRLLTREIHPLPARDRSLQLHGSAKFGRDSSSRAANGYDSAPHRYVTSGHETTPTPVTSWGDTVRKSRWTLTVTATLLLLLQRAACHQHDIIL